MSGYPKRVNCSWKKVPIQANRSSLQLLLAHGAEDNARTDPAKLPLCIAVENRNTDAVKLRLAHGADANAEMGYFGGALHGSVTLRPIYENLDMVRCLLKYGADVNKPAGEFGAPLTVAALCGSPEMMCLLLEYGADANVAAG
ncbi:ankyrin repeat domain-containing protein [Aspergillus mulundensis]|uniref:Uncharacterized protein n=1 Tax=Aspergillus mulundensis TaxID=1810919 RepID=A0A3D8R4C1_9EURO|nr:hypothetical protein DSM5745_08673 [Aspergillus mulundensis]RDW68913.1 hypothetical protein DSM5745_08673 [Aspergillus mulundensis]